LGELEEAREPFQIRALDYTVPDPISKLRNPYLLTYIDHFAKYVEVVPVKDQTAAMCEKMFVTKIVADMERPKL
jgi:hypothetical protein